MTALVIPDELRDTALAIMPAPEANGNGLHPTGEDEEEPTSWEPVDVAAIIRDGCTIPPPTIYARTDGVCLFYAGKMHALNGEPESGKSWMAQHAAAQAMAAGLQVCYLDFEDSGPSVIGRLLALGATAQDLILRFSYINPYLPLTAEATAVLRARFVSHRPALAVVDGITEAMSILGLDPLDNKDTARFFRMLPRKLAGGGSAVVLVDHVVKDAEARGRWAIGSQHKMAALTGAAYTVDAVKPFGRGKAGFARVLVTKDRPGFIRQHAAGSTVAELHIVSSGEGLVAELRAPKQSGEAGFRPTGTMDRICRALASGPALSGRALFAKVGGKREIYQLAIELLIDEGFVGTQRSNRTVHHYPLRPFVDGPDEGGGGDTGEGDEAF